MTHDWNSLVPIFTFRPKRRFFEMLQPRGAFLYVVKLPFADGHFTRVHSVTERSADTALLAVYYTTHGAV